MNSLVSLHELTPPSESVWEGWAHRIIAYRLVMESHTHSGLKECHGK